MSGQQSFGGSKKLAFLALAVIAVGLVLPGWGADKTWVGGTSSLASEDANWQGGAKPATGDSVIMSGAVDMTWDLDDVTLVNWTQNGYTGTVTFETGETGLSAKGVAQTVHGVLVDGERLLKLTGNLNLQSGIWTCKDNPEFNTSNSAKDPAMTSGRGVYRLIVDVAGTAEIGSGATVSVVGKGFQYTQGRWGTAIGGGCGGSHGGCSYSSYDNAIGGSGHAPQHCYGSIRAPITIGSCGGDSVNMQTLPGGAIRLKVSGALTLNGTLNANSSNVPKNGGTAYRAPGSGGSVWVTASSIAGTGAITANGMKHTSFGCSGGGRISVCLTGSGSDFSSFSPSQMTAYGGRKDGTSIEVTASAGTIYLETPANKADGGELRVCGDVTTKELAMATRFGTEIWTGLDDVSFAFAKIYLANNVSLRISDGIVLSAKAMDGLNPSANQMRLYNGNFQQTGSTPFENVRIAVGVSNTVLSSSLRLGTGAQFLPNYPTTVNGNVTLANGAKITHWLNGAADKDYRVNLKVTGDMSIDGDSSVDVEGMGFNSAVGEGKPGISNCASGHGGMPGNPSATGVCYGNFKEPTTLGSGSSHIAGSGAINLEVAGTLTMNGKISAKGMDQVLYPSAGGSVWLKAGQLSGTGTITAIGGNSNNNHTYSAGGGRIAIAVTNASAKVSAFTGTIVAHGGTKTSGNSVVGGAGTIYLRDAGQDIDSGMLIIDNGKCTTSDNKTVITSAMTDETVGSVVITNNAQFFIENNRTLTVKGDWDSRGSSVATIGAAASGVDKAGKVAFAGSGVSAIRGDSYFMDFECTTPGKILKFDTADNLTRIDGELLIAGAAGSLVTLASLNPGSRWALKVDGSASVSYANVSDSDASLGKGITATDSTDGHNNDNWTFIGSIKPGAAITWKTTAASSDWSDINNWEDENGDNRAPIETDYVTISAGSAHYPTLVGATTLAKLTVPSGASFGSGGFDIIVTESLTAGGTLVFDGTETLTLLGNANFGGAAMGTAPAEVVLAGDTSQSVNLGGLSFAKVTLANTTSGEAASISGGFSAKWLYCEQHDLPRTYRFEPGKTVTVTGELRLKGADGANARLSLMSMQSGTRWNIVSRGVAIVAGVSVRDSNAATGNKIYACAPSSGQDCDANWVFNVPTSTWTGGGGNNLFTNDANWAEGAAPTVDSIVYVNTPAEISVGSEADARALTLVVEAGGRAKLTGTARLALADSLQVMGGGTLTADVQVVVNNDAVLFSGATLTCSPNGVWDGVTDPAALTYKRLLIEVGGSMIVESGAAIDVSGKGFAAGDTTYLSGPGYGYGGGYAGWGFRTYPPKASYGSVFAPMSLGSGGDEDVAGGAVRLAIGGTLTLNGSIKANGRDAVSTLQSYKGSGGSVYVTCAALTGSGTIEARGGNVMNDYCGSGGRISVVQSTASGFSAWTGTITAYGGRRIGDAQLPLAPCGTVYLKSAGEAGTVYFDNDNGAHGDAAKDHLGKGYGYTDIISTNLTSDVKADFKTVTLVARRGTTLNLLTDLRVKDLQMLTANTELKLNGHTLSVGVRRHALAGTVIEDGGRIDWWRPGMMVILH